MNEATQNRTKHREEIVVYGWAAKLQITKPGYKDRPVDSSGLRNQINRTICTNTFKSFLAWIISTFVKVILFESNRCQVSLF